MGMGEAMLKKEASISINAQHHCKTVKCKIIFFQVTVSGEKK